MNKLIIAILALVSCSPDPTPPPPKMAPDPATATAEPPMANFSRPERPAVDVIKFDAPAGWSKEEGQLGAKVAVLKALGGNPKLPFFAVLSLGFPRLVTVPRAALQETHDIKELPLGIHSKVVLNDDAAVVPDMLTLELMIEKALNQAA